MTHVTSTVHVLRGVLASSGVVGMLLSLSCRPASSGRDTPPPEKKSPPTAQEEGPYEYHIEPIGYVLPDGSTMPNIINMAGQYPDVCVRKRTAVSTGIEMWEVWRDLDDAKAGRPGWVESGNQAFVKGIVYAVTGLTLTEDSMEIADEVVYKPLVFHWPEDIRDLAEAGQHGSLVVDKVRSDWDRVEPTRNLKTTEGDSLSVNRPLVTCRITLQVENASAEVVSLRAKDLWLAYDDVLVSELTIIESFGKETDETEASVHEEIDIPAGSNTTVRLLNTAIVADDVPEDAVFYLVNLDRGWRIPLGSPGG